MPDSTPGFKRGLLFKLESLFTDKAPSIEIGDVVRINADFRNAYPGISRKSVLKVQLIEGEQATVTFMDANNIYTETIPLVALAKVSRLKN